MVYYLYFAPDGSLHVFEFHDAKSRANKRKHGVDFIEAQALWGDERRTETAIEHGHEVRYLSVGRIDGRYWTAVITYRNNRVRVISVRRSRIEEARIYEAQDDQR